MLPIVLDSNKVQEIFEYVEKHEGAELNVDLPSQKIMMGDKVIVLPWMLSRKNVFCMAGMILVFL